MGRSVIPHPYADVVAYQSFEPDEEYYKMLFQEALDDGDLSEDEDFNTWMWRMWQWNSPDEWDDLEEWVRDTVIDFWPSFYPEYREVRHWNMNTENTVLAQNAHSEVSISEYNGMVAISLAPRSDLDYYDPGLNLGKAWRARVADRFRRTFSQYDQVGRMSNGEEVYRAVQED